MSGRCEKVEREGGRGGEAVNLYIRGNYTFLSVGIGPVELRLL